jgi:putative ABC transport system permease protein
MTSFLMLLRVAARNVTRNPRRTTMILLTLAVGSASLFAFRGFNAGIMNQYRDNTIHARYGYGQINTHGYRGQVFEKPWQHWIDNWDTLKPQLLAIDGVTQVFPRVEFFSLLTNGQITVAGHGVGIDGKEEAPFFNMMNIVQGEALSGQPDGIVLGIGLARSLNVKVGDHVTLLGNTVYGSMNGLDLRVVGIFHMGTNEVDDVMFQVPLEQAQTLLDTKKIEYVALGLKDLDVWDNVSKFVAKHPELDATPFAVLDEVYYQHSVDWLKSQFGVIQAIILSIVILGIFNSVSTAILERKQEIGTLRANGESVGDVMALITLENLLIGIAGGALGVLLEWAFNSTVLRHGILMPPAPGLTRQFFVRVELDWTMAWISFAMTAGCAVVATLLAGVRVTRLSVADALRST